LSKIAEMKNVLLSVFLAVAGMTLFAQNQAVRQPALVLVEGGKFMMGSDSGVAGDHPARQVEISSFCLGKYEITFGEFQRFVTATGYRTDAEQPDSVRVAKGWPAVRENTGTWCTYSTGIPVWSGDSLLPAGNISWNDAAAYCEWLSRETGRKYRLPTEAEWEYAARGGNKSKGFIYSGGNDPEEVAWYLMNARDKTHPVGQKAANELGLYDMTGNVREWCADWYSPSANSSSRGKDPTGPSSGTERVMRGGMWRDGDSTLPIWSRFHEPPYHSVLSFGFRVAVSVQ